LGLNQSVRELHLQTVNFVCTVGMRPLHLAVEAGHSDVVKCLLERGSNVNEPSFDGTTPLHIACECGHLTIVSCFILLSTEVVEYGIVGVI